MKGLSNTKILITGGAGFIGSNLVDYFLENGNEVICLDNLSTGKKENLNKAFENKNFKFINGDIRAFETCKNAVAGCEFVLHQAALGSVPRSIKDPINTNSVNIDGFLNMLVASKEEGIKRFVYAASSSTYGDSKSLPKVEDVIGKPLSPYAITKYVNELYADVFAKTYEINCIGLRYFNVFGRRQDAEGAYAAVIPLWVKNLISGESPVINGDGTYSRDFTYIDNVIQANELALATPDKEFLQYNKTYFSEVFNIAFGGNTTLNNLFEALKENLKQYDKKIESIDPIYGPVRDGDIPHSQASIDKAKRILGYNPKYDAAEGFEKACGWYYNNLR